MREIIKLPKLSETVDEMIVVEWLVAVGDEVEKDQPLVTIETDKVTVEMPAPVAGVVMELLAEADDDVETGAPLAVIETAD